MVARYLWPMLLGDITCMWMLLFMKRIKTIMATVVKKALEIDHYWGRVEFAPRKGAIHLHMICIARYRVYLWAFYQARTTEEKADILNQYAWEVLDMTADVNVNDDPQQKPDYASSPLGKRYCKYHDQIKDVRRLSENCMIHQCNNYCLQSNKTNAPRMCRVHFGTESAIGKMDTQGLPLMPRSRIITNKKGISHFCMTCTESDRVVQHSRNLLRSLRANCDI
jgi:hypothetical protein